MGWMYSIQVQRSGVWQSIREGQVYSIDMYVGSVEGMVENKCIGKIKAVHRTGKLDGGGFHTCIVWWWVVTDE